MKIHLTFSLSEDVVSILRKQKNMSNFIENLILQHFFKEKDQKLETKQQIEQEIKKLEELNNKLREEETKKTEEQRLDEIEQHFMSLYKEWRSKIGVLKAIELSRKSCWRTPQEYFRNEVLKNG